MTMLAPKPRASEDEEHLPVHDAQVRRQDEAQRRAEGDAAEEFVPERDEGRRRKARRRVHQWPRDAHGKGTSAMTKTSHVMTKASVKDASGPAARVCDRTPSVADGLRGVASTAQRIATPRSGPTGSPCTNGMKRRIARNVPAAPIRLNVNCASSGPAQAPRCALRTSRQVELRPACERDERQRQRVHRGERLDRLLVDDGEHVRAGEEPARRYPVMCGSPTNSSSSLVMVPASSRNPMAAMTQSPPGA